jgi:CTP synthase (UTP-ammonia lyase)
LVHPWQSLPQHGRRLLAIRHAREQQRPFLGTCGGFQHALIEYARNVLTWSDADHAESSPDAARAVIAPLACGLLNDFGSLRLIERTRLAQAYGTLQTKEEYLCSYGVNPAFRAALVSGPLRESAVDESGDLRAVERPASPRAAKGRLRRPSDRWPTPRRPRHTASDRCWDR